MLKRLTLRRKLMKRIISITLCMAMVFSMGAVSAADVEVMAEIDGYILAASTSEDLDDGTTIVTSLYLKPSDNARYFDGEKSGMVSRDVYANNGGVLVLNITGYADFMSNGGEEIHVSHSRYTTARYDNDWFFESINHESKDNVNPIFGNKYAKYTINYNAYSTQNVPGALWIKCDSLGSVETRAALLPNQVAVGDTMISFG